MAGEEIVGAGHRSDGDRREAIVVKLLPELDFELREYAHREGICPETAIAEAVRAYLGIEDGVVK